MSSKSDIEQAERAVENAECAAQVEIKDSELRASLIRNFAQALVSRTPKPGYVTLADGTTAKEGDRVWVLRDPGHEPQMILPDLLRFGPARFNMYDLTRCYSTKKAASAAMSNP